MAGFAVHAVTALTISVSAASYVSASAPFPLTWGVALCALGFVGGLLPDIDSNEARIARYSGLALGALASGIVYLLLFNTILALLLFIPFAKMAHYAVKHWTTHRGVFHSIPMGLLLSLTVYYLSDLLRFPHRFSLYCAAFLGGGYLLHLVLDELWSLRKGISKHCSFGTAVQFFRFTFWKSFVATYALLAIAIYYTPILRNWLQKSAGLL